MTTFAIARCSIAGTLLLAAGASAQPAYRLTDLGTLGGQSSACAINGSGIIAGTGSIPGTNAFRATLYNTELVNLGPAGPFQQTVATAVSDAGCVYGVGFALADPDMHTFRFDAFSAVDLGVFSARGVNAQGDLVGISNVSISGFLYPRPCLYRAGMVTNLALLNGGLTGQAVDINDAGRIVGSSLTGALTFPRPVLWTSGANPAIDLGTLLGTPTAAGQAMAINLGGSIVGWSHLTAGVAHATLWRTTAAGAVSQTIALGTLKPNTTSYANAINVTEDIVGTSDFRAFIWSAGQMKDLNTLVTAPGWKLEVASGINNAGWIVGTGTYLGWPRAFLLKPAAPCGPADFGSQGGLSGFDGTLDNNDFIAFINAFFASEPRADLGQPGGLPGADGIFDNNDFIAFINHFFAGCP